MLANNAYIKYYEESYEKNFVKLSRINFITDMNKTNTSIYSREAQLELMALNKKIKNCEGCDEKYLQKETFNSWYELL